MSKLEKYLAKAQESVQRRTGTVTIDGDEWSVRELTMPENRQCFRLAEDDNGRFDTFRYNDVRIVKATEHDFPWNNKELLLAYKAKDKYDLPVKLFAHNQAGYQALLDKVNEVNSKVKTEQEVVNELKNSSEPTEKQATSVGHFSTDEGDQPIS
ncbi:hypothetical protein I532_01470 [Brevibacillus borstelensis AK1]|jgi:hypothetical protein|uniref:Uncharacterized protein n=1 Tax=Brevibacillus borstelensis AK1 TaxID=1300222 RepID=M8DD48_9BACL|nr:hypothetical protein [Brevibacillus borstelensis]EMT54234.1 hypothetical protein I532_01470 [Brevibacillus borstelensis AK1]MED2007003.1 hypothetical protein [Brevibacillus borstelensis]